MSGTSDPTQTRRAIHVSTRQLHAGRIAARIHHAGRIAARIHRLAGVALVVFLPFHFLALGIAFSSTDFSAFISWTNHPLVKLSEWLLVTALALHFAGGIRLLAIETLRTPPLAAFWIAVVFAAGVCGGLLFLLGAF